MTPSPAIDIEVAWKIRTDWKAGPLLKKVAAFAAETEGFKAGQLSITVVGTKAMSTIHQQFLDIAGPTDVITFDLGTNPNIGEIDGEIIVCSDVAKNVAGKRSKTLQAAKNELALYVVHGVLHLAGYDDHSPNDFDEMHATEDAILKKLGIGPVFNANL